MNKSPISRFSNHSEDYQKYRPRYPEAIITYLEQNIGLNKAQLIADIGSGTGIFTELLLNHHYQVLAVEPNAQMRSQAETRLKQYPKLKHINGMAEQTDIAAHTVDLITVAQSFHWFDLIQTKAEFKRILKPGGHVLLVWNILQRKSQFLKAYQALKDKYTDRKPYVEKLESARIESFLGPAKIVKQEIYHSRLLGKEELLGYFRSSSYSPIQGEAGYEKLVTEIDQLFSEHEQNGFVKLEYDAKLFFSSLDKT